MCFSVISVVIFTCGHSSRKPGKKRAKSGSYIGGNGAVGGDGDGGSGGGGCGSGGGCGGGGCGGGGGDP